MRETYNHKWPKDFHIYCIYVELRHDCITSNGTSRPLCRVSGTGVPIAQVRKLDLREEVKVAVWTGPIVPDSWLSH